MANAPVWQQFMSLIATKAQSLGISVEEKKQWVVYTGPNGHRLALQKSPRKLPRIESTLDLTADLPEVVEEIRDNGRMRCALMPTPEVVGTAFELMTDANNVIPAPRRGGKSSSIPDINALLAPTVSQLVAASEAIQPTEAEVETAREELAGL